MKSFARTPPAARATAAAPRARGTSGMATAQPDFHRYQLRGSGGVTFFFLRLLRLNPFMLHDLIGRCARARREKSMTLDAWSSKAEGAHAWTRAQSVPNNVADCSRAFARKKKVRFLMLPKLWRLRWLRVIKGVTVTRQEDASSQRYLIVCV